MQIFGQNVYGIFEIQEGIYSGELAMLFHRLINAQLSVTRQHRLSGLSTILTGNQQLLASIMVLSNSAAASVTINVPGNRSLHKASISIE